MPSSTTISSSDLLSEYIVPFLKVTLAFSPIILIVTMLFFGREDEEEEQAKLERQKKTASCKT